MATSPDLPEKEHSSLCVRGLNARKSGWPGTDAWDTSAPSEAAATLRESPDGAPETLAPGSAHDDTVVASLAAESQEVAQTDACPSADRSLLGTVIDGRYRVEALLGEGAMGLVYRCRHEVINKLVAIKVLRQSLVGDREAAGRFVTEAKAASAAGSKHIVETIDFGRLPDGSTYFVMEYLQGVTLGNRMAAESLPIKRLLDICRQVAEGLQEAHDAGIVHRDLKPENVFLLNRRGESDFVKILDFGIAKVSSEQSKLTRAGEIFGTPHYMSPEQAKGSAIDHRTDVYSLGVVLYELATGKLPFDAETPVIILSQHMYRLATPPRELAPDRDIPAELEAVIMKCLAKEPEHRYQSMSEVAAELDRVARGFRPRAMGHSAVRPRARVLKRALHAAAVLVTMGGVTTAVAVARAPDAAPVLKGKVLRWHPGLGSAVRFIEDVQRARPGPAVVNEEGLREVALVVSPIDAAILRDGEALGLMPVTMRLARNEAAEVVVQREGYHSKRVLVDGSAARVVVRLEPVSSADDLPEPGEAKTQADETASEQQEELAELRTDVDGAAVSDAPSLAAVSAVPSATAPQSKLATSLVESHTELAEMPAPSASAAAASAAALDAKPATEANHATEVKSTLGSDAEAEPSKKVSDEVPPDPEAAREVEAQPENDPDVQGKAKPGPEAEQEEAASAAEAESDKGGSSSGDHDAADTESISEGQEAAPD